jgi:hypothetical protein
MNSVFLSFRFQVTDQKLVGHVKRLIESHQLRVIDGDGMGQGELTAAIERRIEGCDALVAIMTRRDEAAERGLVWVRDEFGHARSKQRPCVALVENGVSLGGIHGGQETIPFTNDGEHFVLLSGIIHDWKQRLGRKLNIKMLPSKIAEGLQSGQFECEYRFRNTETNQPTQWEKLGRPWREAGGFFAQINGFREGHLLELQVNEGTKRWMSEATSGSWIPIDLTPPEKRRFVLWYSRPSHI